MSGLLAGRGNPPPVIHDPALMQAAVLQARQQGKRVGLVPTMGALHAGHGSLVQRSNAACDFTVVTIFVNPTQFGPREDFSRYPRTLPGDLALLSQYRVDAVFVPEAKDMYPPGFSTYVEPPAAAQPLEGVCRPGHFRGVCTVVLKLFQMAPAHVAFFGQKDFQQALVIRRMTADLNVPMEIEVCPTVRESDGLAMSSRNRYLNAAERTQALALWQALQLAKQSVLEGERQAARIADKMRRHLQAAGISDIEYAAVCDPETLVELNELTGSAVALLAARVGTTRLIDNERLC